MSHTKVSQFWVSESGMAASGRAQHGYFAVCSCGAEVYSGPSTPYDVPQPPRLLELREKELTQSPEEEAEFNKLFKKWNAEFRASLDASNKLDLQHMREAIEKHAAAQPKQQAGEAVSA